MLFEYKKLPIHQKHSISQCGVCRNPIFFFIFYDYQSFSINKKLAESSFLYVGANALILQVIVKRLFCSFSFQIHMERDVVYGHRRFHAGGWQSITLPWMKERGWTPPVSPPSSGFLQSHYSEDFWPGTCRSSLTIYRYWSYFNILNKNSLFYFQPSYCILLFLLYTFIFNSKNKLLAVPCKKM